MDDGAVNFNEKQRPRIRLCTNGFSYDEVNRLKEMFSQRYNIFCNIGDYKGFTLTLTADSSEKFFSLIFPFVPDGMKYKLPKKYRDFKCVLDSSLKIEHGVLDTEVVSVSNYALHQPKYQYDISVEDNRNYFVRGVLVHNTCLNTCYDPLGIIGSVKLKFQGKTEKTDMPKPLLYNLQTHFLPRINILKDIFGELKVEFIMEGYGSKIQKGGGNYTQDQKFVLFDLKIKDHWQKRSDVLDIADKMDISTVPIVGKGTLNEMVDFVREGFLSTWGPFNAEGVVARPLVEMNTRIGQRIITKLKYKDFGRGVK